MDLNTAQMLKELPHEGLLNLLYIFNAVLRLDYWSTSLKRAQIIMIQKPGKDPTDVSSYGPISLLPIISKSWKNNYINGSIKTCISKTGYRTTNSASDRRSPQCNNVIE